MTLIKSISGIRGIIGGKESKGLTPIDIVKSTGAYAQIICNSKNKKIVIGRDGRISGEAVQNLVMNTLYFMGVEVIDLGLSTTPTVEMAVVAHKAAGGIIITASHNTQEWNALKLFNDKGEFISEELGLEIQELVNNGGVVFESIKKLGSIVKDDTALDYHITQILNHELVDKQVIAKRDFKIIVDAINSSGAIAVPQLLIALGVKKENITVINAEINGKFAHNPEPLPEHLNEIKSLMQKGKYDLGIVVDPDVDRLCFLCEDGKAFGEEYTLVAVADYVLSKTKGKKVSISNLSSTRALLDITNKHGGTYYSSAVGEVNVVEAMKENKAVIGGEGNGGVIDPSLHYGRDALIGIALFLTHLAIFGGTASQKRALYPHYFICKNKINLDESINLKKIFSGIQKKYKKNELNTIDGLKITFENGDWVHLRSSNTEPIIRIYTESNNKTTAENMAQHIKKDIAEIIREF